MKFIQKKAEPASFANWKALESDEWSPSYRALPGKIKKALKESLIQDQGKICCYCERRLQLDDSHIEHFQPQSSPEVDPLDYSNLLCSCQNRLKPKEPRHCGNSKGDWFDAELLISPLNEFCEEC